jgi:hypothetical protein
LGRRRVAGWWLVGALASGLLLALGCGRQTAQEKLTEQVLKGATGKDTQVRIDGDRVQIADADSKTEMAATATWPDGLSTEVPRFAGGRIARVVKTIEQGDTWTYNIYLADIGADDIGTYDNALKATGWKTEALQMGGKGGMLNGQKGTMGINMMYNLEDKDGMLAVFNRP